MVFEFLMVWRGAPRNLATILIRYSEPGAPQGSRGPFGVMELFSRRSVVYRTTLGASQGPPGSPRGSGSRRFRRSVRRWHAEDVAVELSGSQPKKESDGRQQIGIVLELIDSIDIRVINLNLVQEFLNSIREFPNNFHEFPNGIRGILKLATIKIGGKLEVPPRPSRMQPFADGTCADHDCVHIRVRVVLSSSVVSCFVCAIQFVLDCRACVGYGCADLPVSFGASAFSVLAFAPPPRLRCPSRACSRGTFLFCLSLLPSPPLCPGDGFVSPFPVWWGEVAICILVIAVLACFAVFFFVLLFVLLSLLLFVSVFFCVCVTACQSVCWPVC